MKPLMIFAALTLPLTAMPLQPGLAQGQGLALGRIEATKGPHQGHGKPIPRRYIVTLEPKANPRQVAADNGIEPDFVYTQVLTGFAGTMSDLAHSKLRSDNRVVRVEQDTEREMTQTANSWGIDRIDQRSLPLNSSYAPSGTGAGANAYILDTGINFSHVMFGGRAIHGIDVINDGRNGSDCNGHGTHVAGTVGGGYGYGVAPGVTLISARVLNCQGSGSTSGIIYAMDWIASQGRRPAVANMSLGGSASASLDDAVRNLTAFGVTTVVAAGNDNADACTQSPARAADAVTVGATDQSDRRATFSNYGSCVDIFAPGVSIVSAYYNSNNGLASMSGTSMATPHVVGAAAIELGKNPSMSPAAVRNALVANATLGAVLNAMSNASSIIYVGTGSVAPPPPPPPPPTPTPTPTPTITLTATVVPVFVVYSVSLKYSGATTSRVDIYRNGTRVASPSNTGSYSNRVSAGTYRFKVCNYQTTVCSNEVTIST
jgi:subtilisin family serine protease